MPALLRAGLFLLESKVIVKRKEIYETGLQKNNILKVKKAGKKPLTFKELLRSCRGKGFEFEKFTKAVDKMKKNGEIMENKFGIRLVDPKKFVKCEVVRLNKTYGFVKNIDTDEEIFVVGKYLKGAMPHDIVLVRTFKGEGACTEGEVMSIVEENFAKFTGELVSEFGVLKIVPDMLSKYAMSFENPMRLELHEGDKVVAQVTKRGNRHSEHVCEIVSSYGSSMKASACAMSVLEVNGLTPVFPSEVIYEAREVSDYSRIKEEIPNRLDLRDKPIFTIDGADTKDIDDAISVERTKTGYLLGVHIADVSHYVQPKSQLDNEAFKRGTSVYYANRVIPMLPKELSNGICSLNPQEDRLAFSCLCELDKQGNITDYKFAKTVIRSRVKGVYSEINSLLAGSDDAELKEKYAEVSGQLPVIKELADILYKTRKTVAVLSLRPLRASLSSMTRISAWALKGVPVEEVRRSSRTSCSLQTSVPQDLAWIITCRSFIVSTKSRQTRSWSP